MPNDPNTDSRVEPQDADGVAAHIIRAKIAVMAAQNAMAVTDQPIDKYQDACDGLNVAFKHLDSSLGLVTPKTTSGVLDSHDPVTIAALCAASEFNGRDLHTLIIGIAVAAAKRAQI